MRQLHDHKTNGANRELDVRALDAPGSGGAHHLYQIEGYSPHTNPSYVRGSDEFCTILFQNGPINEVGVNGITHEALLAVLIDRLRSFQNGPYACRENAIALTKLEEAMMWLGSRTRAREARGVEGTHKI